MLEFEVKDMTCGHCVSTITRAIEKEAAGASVEVDLENHVVRIGGTSDSTRVAAAIREAGFTPVAKASAAKA